MIARFALLFLGLLSGVLVAGAAFYSFLGPSSVPAPAEATARSPAPPAAMIAVASGTIPTGKLITPQDVRFAPQGEGGTFDGEFVRPQAPTPVDQAKADHDIVDKISGAVSRRKISSGDPILRTEIVKPGESGFLAAVLEPGKRAITIGVTAISGAAGLIYPGDRVDIIARGDAVTYTTLRDDFQPAPQFPSREETPWTHGGPPPEYVPTDDDAQEAWS